MTFIEWENQICDLIVGSLEISRSDAQGIMEANDSLLCAQWNTNRKPHDATQSILIEGGK